MSEPRRGGARGRKPLLSQWQVLTIFTTASDFFVLFNEDFLAINLIKI